MKIERGDILMVNLGQVPGTSLQSGIRPVVVVSNNKANTYSPVVTVVPFTSRVYKNVIFRPMCLLIVMKWLA